MKLLSVFSFILGAGIAVSQVGATPLEVIVGQAKSNTVIRVGVSHEVAPPTVLPVIMSDPAAKPKNRKHGCMRTFRNKAKKLSNWVLVAFSTRPAQAQSEGPNSAVRLPAHVAQRPFTERLTRALMMLSPWEGRAVAFILGCGIGVLVRMVWVLVVLAVRSVRGKKQREEFIEDEVLFEEEEYLLAPPQYTGPVQAVSEKKKDEKEAQRDA